MPKRKPDVHVEVELRTNHGKRKEDRATIEAPQTFNFVPVEQAEENYHGEYQVDTRKSSWKVSYVYIFLF